MKLKPYYIVPLLVEQPTWGGLYIAEFKGLDKKSLTSAKIGQAFELAQESILVENMEQPNYLLAEATALDHPKQFGKRQHLLLADLITHMPKEVLGTAVFQKYGAKMPLLIKFTQAQNNSYQVHVRPGSEFGNWLPKPESWYYFEPGIATLGLDNSKKIADYKARCLEIENTAQTISTKIITNILSLEEGVQALQAFINKDHPRNYVNTVPLATDSVVDLSQGGIHHSWETDPDVPSGNIVYEVQADVKDEFCTLRSFDQGKIKEDGTVRAVSIDDYFKALNTDPKANRPSQYVLDPPINKDQQAEVRELFSTPHYHLTHLKLDTNYQGKQTETTEGFHHLFVKKGACSIHYQNEQYPLKKGWSLFIPAKCNSYRIETTVPTEILKTTI